MPDQTAVRVALWRALHREVDQHPLIFDDTIALELAAPPPGWRARGDMGRATIRARASIVARARLAEDVVIERVLDGVDQYVVLGAGLDTFVQRRTDLLDKLRVFEVDQHSTQIWKQERLAVLGLTDDRQTFVPVDFDRHESWWTRLIDAGFDPHRPAVFTSLGVSMYLTEEANALTFKQISAVAGSAFVFSFQVPTELVESGERRTLQTIKRGAQRGGSPWVSSYRPESLIELAHQNGFGTAEQYSSERLATKYFSNRTDELSPSSIEHILVATT